MTDRTEGIVECPEHGTEGPAFVCRHLNLEAPVGFIEGYDPDDPETELFQAWCHACDEVLQREGDGTIDPRPSRRSAWSAALAIDRCGR